MTSDEGVCRGMTWCGERCGGNFCKIHHCASDAHGAIDRTAAPGVSKPAMMVWPNSSQPVRSLHRRPSGIRCLRLVTCSTCLLPTSTIAFRFCRRQISARSRSACPAGTPSAPWATSPYTTYRLVMSDSKSARRVGLFPKPHRARGSKILTPSIQ